MRHPEYPPGTLIIDRFHSDCNACGHGADMTETHHNRRLGYGDHDGKGCGVKFTHVTHDFVGLGIAEAIQRDRPDLIYIDPLARLTGAR